MVSAIACIPDVAGVPIFPYCIVQCTVYIPSATGVSEGSGIHPDVVCTPNVQLSLVLL